MGVGTARVMARLRTGYASTNSFLHRHGLCAHDLCDLCLFVLGEENVETVAHRLMCPGRPDRVACLRAELNSIFGFGKWTIRGILEPSLELGLQIRVSNALHAFALSTGDRGII